MDELKDLHVKWNKPNSGLQVSHFLPCVLSNINKYKIEDIKEVGYLESRRNWQKWRGEQQRKLGGGYNQIHYIHI